MVEMTPEQGWRVRVHNLRGRVVGAGVLLDGCHILTAAHVVSRAAPDESPGARVRVDFLSPDQSRTATLLADGWAPSTAEGGGDLAVLALDDPLVIAVDRPVLRPCGPAGGRSVRFVGYPPGSEAGVWAQARLIGYSGPASERVQLGSLDPGLRRAAAGFSGAGVVDEAAGAVIGYITAQSRSNVEATWVVPLEVAARYWRPLLPLLADPDRPPSAASMSAGQEPTSAAVRALVDALLRVRAMADESSRHRIVDLLPSGVAHAIRWHPSAQLEIFNIVRACLDYPGGFRELVEIIRTFEGSSAAMARLDDVVAELPDAHRTA